MNAPPMRADPRGDLGAPDGETAALPASNATGACGDHRLAETPSRGGARMPDALTTSTETVPGLAAARADRWIAAMADFIDGAHAGLGAAPQARDAWRRGWRNDRLRRFLAGAVGVPDRGGPLYGRPGAAAFAGVARAEFFDGARAGFGGPMWSELPLYDLKVGQLVVTVPLLRAETTAARLLAFADPDEIDPALKASIAGGVAHRLLTAVDLIAIDPVGGSWASLTDLHDGFLGHVWRLDPEEPTPLYRSALGWLKAGGSTFESLGPAGLCLLDPDGRAVEDLLLDTPLACEDDDHCAEIYELQQAARRRALARARRTIGPGGRLYVAGPGGGAPR